MTRNVRIENADTAPYEIAVDVVDGKVGNSWFVRPAPEPAP